MNDKKRRKQKIPLSYAEDGVEAVKKINSLRTDVVNPLSKCQYVGI